MFDAMSKCQQLHPDPADSPDDDEEEEEGDEGDEGDEGEEGEEEDGGRERLLKLWQQLK
jgi:hypothetical protein